MSRVLVNINLPALEEKAISIGFPKIWDTDETDSLSVFLANNGFTKFEADIIYTTAMYYTEPVE